jgi:hypothetical protein
MISGKEVAGRDGGIIYRTIMALWHLPEATNNP